MGGAVKFNYEKNHASAAAGPRAVLAEPVVAAVGLALDEGVGPEDALLEALEELAHAPPRAAAPLRPARPRRRGRRSGRRAREPAGTTGAHGARCGRAAAGWWQELAFRSTARGGVGRRIF